MTLPEVKLADWAARGLARWWMEIPDPPAEERFTRR